MRSNGTRAEHNAIAKCEECLNWLGCKRAVNARTTHSLPTQDGLKPQHRNYKAAAEGFTASGRNMILMWKNL